MFKEAVMRSIYLLIAGSILASCTTAPPPPGPPMRSASGERAYQNLVAGKVPQQPISCLPNRNSNDMSIIDGRTLGFRVGSGNNSGYLVHLTEGCEMLGGGTYTLLSRQAGGMGLCQGDIQQVVDVMNHVTAGSCTVAAIVPYVRR
jgi:hypothetical protein